MATALQQPKKPVGGAYGQFMAEKRSEFAKACEGKPVSAVTQLGAEAWKKLTEADKAPYQKKYEAAKSKFDTDMAAFLAAGGEKEKGSRALAKERREAKEDPKAKAKRALKEDPNRPKRPAGGAYGCYLAQHREAFQKECPGSITGVTKLASSKWKALSEKEKEPYEEEFKKKQAAYNEAMKSYVPPTVESAAGDESSASDEASPAKSSPGKRGKKASAPAPAAGSAPAKRAKKGAAVAPGVELEAKVVQEAEKLNLLGALRNLAARPDIVASGKSNEDLLEALRNSGGLVNPAKTALLGA